VVRAAGRSSISSFLSSHPALSLVRPSGKVVVFSTSIPIQLAFYALVEHDTQSAPLWDEQTRSFEGLLTVSDFISLLRDHSGRKLPPAQLSSLTIKEVMAASRLPPPPGGRAPPGVRHDSFPAVKPTANLLQVCQLLLSTGRDFLPVMLPEDSRVLAVVT
jgi:hypothetical protein